MTHNPIDDSLVLQAKRGDGRAFEVLVKRYQRNVVALACRYGIDQSEALDVAQEVFIRAYRFLPTFRGDSSFYTWLYRITVNVSKQFQLAGKHRLLHRALSLDETELAEMETWLRDLNNPETQLLTEEIYRAVRAALDALTEELRTALSLREFEGLSYSDIAKVMHCPVGTVRSRIFRARESLNAALKPLLQA